MVYCLHTIDFTIIGTTRKNAASLLVSLITLLVKDKEAKKEVRKDNRGVKKK